MDFYQLLGVSYSATFNEIKKAFRELSKKYHPDVYPNATPEMLEKLKYRFSVISEAYNTLSDENKKRKYDIVHDIYRKRVEEQNQKENNIKDTREERKTEEVVVESAEESEIKEAEKNKKTDSYVADYDHIKRFLDTNYKSDIINDVRVYFEDDKPIALCYDDIITMYFKCDRKEIWNHNDRVMVSIVKDAIISNNYKANVCDAVMFRGMCGTPNIIKREYKYFMNEDYVGFIDNHDLGSIGSYIDGNFVIGEGTIIISVDLKYEKGFDDSYYGILNNKASFEIDKNSYANEWEKLKKFNDWYWNDGYNTTGSSYTRQRIMELQKGCNYHKTYPASIKIKEKVYNNLQNIDDDSEFDTSDSTPVILR